MTSGVGCAISLAIGGKRGGGGGDAWVGATRMGANTALCDANVKCREAIVS